MDQTGGKPTPQSGLEYLQGLVGRGMASGMSRTMNLRLAAIADGCATIEGHPAPEHYNPQMRVHGGYCATLIDSAMGCAVQSKLPANVGYGTIEMKVSYVARLTAESNPVYCTAMVIHSGRTMFTAEAKVTGGDGKLYAHGSGTFLVYPT